MFSLHTQDTLARTQSEVESEKQRFASNIVMIGDAITQLCQPIKSGDATPSEPRTVLDAHLAKLRKHLLQLEADIASYKEVWVCGEYIILFFPSKALNLIRLM